MGTAPATRRQTALALIAIALFAAFLRVRAMEMPFWFDEAFSWRISQSGWRELLTRVSDDNHSPFFFALLKVWTAALGTSLYAMRSLSLVFSLGAVLAAFFLARRIGSPSPRAELAGLLAALFFAVHPYQVFWGAETRMYALAMLLVLLATHAWVAALEAADRIVARWILYGLCAAAAIYAHYFSLFVIGAQAAISLGIRAFSREENRARAGAAWIGFAACGLAFLPWMRAFLIQRSRTSTSWWSPPLDGARALRMLVRGLLPLPPASSLRLYGALAIALAVCALALAHFGNRRARWILGCVVVALVIATCASIAGQNLLQSLYLQLPMLLLLAVGAATLAEGQRRAPIALGTAITLALLYFWGRQSIALPATSLEADLPAVLAFLEEVRPPDEPVIADSYDYFALRYYLASTSGWTVYGRGGHVDSFNGGALIADDDRVAGERELAAIQARHVWVIENSGGFGTRKVLVPASWKPGPSKLFGPVRVMRYQP